MKASTLAALLATAGLGLAASTADAQGPYRHYAGYGNGPHDYAPHWHRTDTIFGSGYWYGNGLHDYLPHNHTYSPRSGVRSYSFTPLGPTTSYNGFPYTRDSYSGYTPYWRGYCGNW